MELVIVSCWECLELEKGQGERKYGVFIETIGGECRAGCFFTAYAVAEDSCGGGAGESVLNCAAEAGAVGYFEVLFSRCWVGEQRCGHALVELLDEMENGQTC